MRKKFVISSFSFPRDQEPIMEEAEKIAAREGKSFSEFLFERIKEYVSIHSAGNPSFEITKWIEKPEFKGHPAVCESNEKWDKYLNQSDEKEISQLEGTFLLRAKQAREAWLKKKGLRK